MDTNVFSRSISCVYRGQVFLTPALKHRRIDTNVFSHSISSQRATAHTLQNVSDVNRERSRLAAASCVCDSTKHNGLVTSCLINGLKAGALCPKFSCAEFGSQLKFFTTDICRWVRKVLSKKSYPNCRGRVIHTNKSRKKFIQKSCPKKFSKIT